MTKFRNCPFCGSDEVELWPLDDAGLLDKLYCCIVCGNCGSATSPQNTEAEAVALWNGDAARRRTKPDDAECPNCKCGHAKNKHVYGSPEEEIRTVGTYCIAVGCGCSSFRPACYTCKGKGRLLVESWEKCYTCGGDGYSTPKKPNCANEKCVASHNYCPLRTECPSWVPVE